ncbi:hypothetical protein C8R48DRAFT_800042, partial [Suillus tomentosus]
SRLLQWVPPSLPAVKLGYHGSSQNPTVLQFFTWDARHPDMSRWEHLVKPRTWLYWDSRKSGTFRRTKQWNRRAADMTLMT